ncbi:DUF1616 domain-containing protein [Caldivirga maquilingensis]|uniref:DUF1616 domain-containing protein n=1 Tax=Caldivirga maquilingensis (strain ATCC 700844 / DSM 13496 / JCM 10307 / IC-167) TaxID=397948 RepID=A8M970_CALMQ|nr:DUF1616 domain-containing protein [Caldivirga maquilingensis]ABW02289.1 hypothetical protein Cmaq_1465 [Caldivirga maquilingensis IC-167]
MKSHLLILILIILIIGVLAIPTVAQVNQLLIAYSMVSKLGAEGVNVTSLVNSLNEAIEFEQEGYTSNATLIAEHVITTVNSMAPVVHLHHVLNTALTIIVLLMVITLSVLLYVRRREILGRLWLRFRGRYSVNRISGSERTLLFNEEVLAVVVAVIVVLVVFGVAITIIGGSHEPFSAIALLNSNMHIGNYPTVIAVGQPVHLYLFIYNHMNKLIWYVVKVYIMSNTTVEPPLVLTPIVTYQVILLNNATYTAPLTFSLNSTGTYRVIAELWYYDPSNLTLTYTGNYVQLWINATGVMPSG